MSEAQGAGGTIRGQFGIREGTLLRLIVANVAGQRLLIATGAAPHSLTLYDLADPSTPRLVGAFDLGTVVDATVAGHHLYVCSLSKGLVALDLKDPQNPVPLHRWGADLPVVPSALAVMGRPEPGEPTLLCVAVRIRPAGGETTEDWFGPGYPASDWESPPPDTARPIADTEFLGLHVLHHQPSGEAKGFSETGFRPYPKIGQARYTGHHQPWEVATVGRLALVAAGRSGLFIFDLSRLDTPDPGQLHCPGCRVRGVKVAGYRAFVTGDGIVEGRVPEPGFLILDMRTPKQPTVMHPWGSPPDPPAVRTAVLGGGVLVLEAVGHGRLSYRHLGSPSADTEPFSLADGEGGSPPTDLAVLPGWVYVATPTGRILVVRALTDERLGAPPRFAVQRVVS